MKLLDDIKAAFYFDKCRSTEHYADSVQADWDVIDSCDKMTEGDKLVNKQLSMDNREAESHKMIKDWSANIMDAYTRITIRIGVVVLASIAALFASAAYVDWINY